MTASEAEERPRTIRDAFRDNPEWRKLYLARTISLLGDWFNLLTVVYLLGKGETHSAIAFAIVFALKNMPVFLFGPAAGVVADRYNRKRIMIACDLLAMGIVLLFLFSESVGSKLYIYILVALQLSVTAFFEPSRQSVLPSVCKKEDLLSANALSSASWSIVFTLGSFLGGVVLAFLGWKVAIVIDAATYLISASILLSLRVPPRDSASPILSPTQKKTWRQVLGIEDAILGLRYILNHVEVRRLILVKFGWGTMGAITLFLTLLGATDAYLFAGKPELGISYLWGCRGIGTLFGPFLARYWAKSDNARLKTTLTVAYFVAPLFYLLVAFTQQDWLLTGLLVYLSHLGGSTLWVISTVLLQGIVPEEFRGRTFAAELGLVTLAMSVSNLVYAAFLELGWLDLTACMIVAPLVCLLPAFHWLRGQRQSKEAPIAS